MEIQVVKYYAGPQGCFLCGCKPGMVTHQKQKSLNLFRFISELVNKVETGEGPCLISI